MGEFTDKVKGTFNEAAGKIKQHSDNPQTRAEGMGQEIKGKAQQAAGAIKGVFGDKI